MNKIIVAKWPFFEPKWPLSPNMWSDYQNDRYFSKLPLTRTKKSLFSTKMTVKFVDQTIVIWLTWLISHFENLDRFSRPWIPAYSATNHRPRTAHKLKWYDLTHALNMWPSYVKNHSTLGRRLVSFIFIEKFGLYELKPSMIQVLIDQFYSFIKTYAIIKI